MRIGRQAQDRGTLPNLPGGDGPRFVQLDANGKQVKPEGKRAHATPHEKGAAVDLYFDGHSYRWTADNMEQYFDRETNTATVYRWARDLSKKADAVLRTMKVDTGGVWVADEVSVKVGGKRYWLFNVMDSDTRFLLSAYLSPTRTTGRRRRRWRWRGGGRTTRPGKSKPTGWRRTAMPCRGLFQPIR